MRNNKTETIYVSYHTALPDLLALVKEPMEKYDLPMSAFYIMTEGDGDDISLHIEYRRPETDEEVLVRMAREEKSKLMQLELQRKQYQELKKKFETS